MTYGSDAAHCVVDTAGSKTTLDDLETTAFAEDEVVNGYANILERDVTMAVRSVIIPKNTEGTVDGDTGGIGRNEHDRLLLVRVLVCGIGLSHGDVDLAARVGSAGRPPLGTIEDVFVAAALNAETNVGGIRGGNVGFSHEEGRTNLSLEQRVEPLALLGLVAVLGQDLHVAGVGSGAVAGLL